MDKDRSFEYIKKEAGIISVNPPNSSWTKLRLKLDSTTGHKKAFTIGYAAAIAAALLVLISAFAFFQFQSHHFNTTQPQLALEWEQLDTSEEYFYSPDQIRELYAAYSN